MIFLSFSISPERKEAVSLEIPRFSFEFIPRKQHRLRVWQRMLLCLAFLFLLALLGTAVMDFSGERLEEEAVSSESGWVDSVEGYVLADEGEVSVPLYTEGLAYRTECGRGTLLEIESWEPFIAEDGTEYYHVFYEGQKGYILTGQISAAAERVLRESQIYVRTPTNLYLNPEENTLGTLVDKGTALNVVGYDYIKDDGSVHMYQVVTGEISGWIRSEYTCLTFVESMENWSNDDGSYDTHVSRGSNNSNGGGDAGKLDYFPRETVDFSDYGNTMPDACYCLYVPLSSDIQADVDTYLALAEGTEINTFIFTVQSDSYLAFPSTTLSELGVTGYAFENTAEDYAAAIQKVKDAGYYTVGRMTVFNDGNLANAYPAESFQDLGGNLLLLGGEAWPSPYSRKIWQIKVEMAVEIAETAGFNEMMLDYVQFPYGSATYEQTGYDMQNNYGEDRSQALQRFLMYACDILHEHHVYVSTCTGIETAGNYVNIYGQYWAAFSTVVDVFCPQVYPEDYTSYWTSTGYYRPYQHPYDTVSSWAYKVYWRQQECSSGAVIRPYIQTWGYDSYPYDNDVIEREILALYDNEVWGGYILTYYNGVENYEQFRDAMSTDYYALYREAEAREQALSVYMGADTSDDLETEEDSDS